MNSMRRRLMVLLAVILLFFQLISVIWLWHESREQIGFLVNETLSAKARNNHVEKEIRDRLSAIHLGENGAIDIWRRHVEDALASVQSRSRLIGEYDPDVVLRRGYALVEGEKVINNVVTITTVNEIMKARIEEYEKRHDN